MSLYKVLEVTAFDGETVFYLLVDDVLDNEVKRQSYDDIREDGE
jgi:hypothetical protein